MCFSLTFFRGWRSNSRNSNLKLSIFWVSPIDSGNCGNFWHDFLIFTKNFAPKLGIARFRISIFFSKSPSSATNDLAHLCVFQILFQTFQHIQLSCCQLFRYFYPGSSKIHSQYSYHRFRTPYRVENFEIPRPYQSFRHVKTSQLSRRWYLEISNGL